MSIKKNRLFFIALNVTSLFISIIISIILQGYNKSDWAYILSLFAIIIFVFEIVQMIYLHIPVTDFRMLFIIFNYLFIFGRILLYGFSNGEYIFWDLSNKYTISNMMNMGTFALCSIQSLFIGFFAFVNDTKNMFKQKVNDHLKNKKMFISGLFCFIIGLPCTLYTDLIKIRSVSISNSYRTLEINVGIIDDLAIMLIASVFLIACSNVISRRKTNTIIVLFLLYEILIMIMTGDRRYQISLIMCLAIFLLRKNNINLSFFKSCFTFIGVLVILNLLYLIRDFRDGNLIQLTSYLLSNISSLFSLNVFFETLSEFGISFYSLCSVGKYIPSYFPFQLGKTFIYSLGAVLPLGLMQNNSFYEEASYSNIINNIEGTHVGCTLIGDFYINFGWFSIFFLIVFAYILYYFLYKKTKLKEQFDLAKYYILFYIFISLPRATISQSIRMILFGVLFPYIFIRILNIFAHNRKH